MAMFAKEGWLALIWGILLLPVGFVIQAIALLKSHALPRWQSILFLIGVLLVAKTVLRLNHIFGWIQVIAAFRSLDNHKSKGGRNVRQNRPAPSRNPS